VTGKTSSLRGSGRSFCQKIVGVSEVGSGCCQEFVEFRGTVFCRGYPAFNQIKKIFNFFFQFSQCNECNKLFLHSNFLFEHIQRKHNNNHNNINLNNLNPNSKAIKILGVKNNDFILDNNEELINNNKLNNIKRQRRGHSERYFFNFSKKNIFLG